MTFPSFTTYLVELLFCAFVLVAVRTVGGRWIGPGARRLLWVPLILKHPARPDRKEWHSDGNSRGTSYSRPYRRRQR